MRLVCPSCEAKYEVPDDAIPDTGRDVQCANCNHSWFQMRPRSGAVAPSIADPDEAEPAEAEGQVVEATTSAAPENDAAPPETEAAISPAPAAVGKAEAGADLASGPAEPETEAEAVASDAGSLAGDPPAAAEAEEPVVEIMAAKVEAAPEADPDTEADIAEAYSAVDGAPEAVESGTAPGLAAYAVDESVLAILREEAEREATARRAEASPLETQPGLGIDSALGAKPTLVAVALDSDGDPGTKASARRDLLPDVEEINSTLRPSEQPGDEDGGAAGFANPVREGRGSFRSGFLLVMTFSILGAAIYIGAPRLSEMIPSLADPLISYVKAVDALRQSLDGLMRSATVAINGE